MNGKPEAGIPGRRAFLKGFAVASGTLPFVPGGDAIASLATTSNAASAGAPATAPGYLSLSPGEAAFVEALVNVMCPADNLTPAGVECGLATFIDRQLAGDFGRGDGLYRQGPFAPGKPQLGYQSPLTPELFFKAGIASVQAACVARFGKGFDALGITDADAFLQDIAGGKVVDPHMPVASWFNELVYPLFTQACFADPMYGGNDAKVFWKLVGYPGLPAFHTQNITVYRGRKFPGSADPKSMSDFS